MGPNLLSEIPTERHLLDFHESSSNTDNKHRKLWHFSPLVLIAGNGMRMRCDREGKEEEAVIRSHFIYPPTKLPSALPATLAEGEGVATAFYIKNAIFEG